MSGVRPWTRLGAPWRPRQEYRRKRPRGVAPSSAMDRTCAWHRTRLGSDPRRVLTRGGVRRQDHFDDRAPAVALVDGEDAVQRARPLGELLQAAQAPLSGGVVRDRRLDGAV